jgi:transcriptional regulator with XRE-family HTH domain
MTLIRARRTLGQRLGIAIARLRAAKEWSRATLARRADMSETYIRRIERGVQVPTLTIVVELADVLGVTPAELVRQATEPESLAPDRDTAPESL